MVSPSLVISVAPVLIVGVSFEPCSAGVASVVAGVSVVVSAVGAGVSVVATVSVAGVAVVASSA